MKLLIIALALVLSGCATTVPVVGYTIGTKETTDNELLGTDVVLTLENKNGVSLGYSQYKYDFEGATRKGVIYPSLDPSIFELKYPQFDIIGSAT